MSRLVTGYLRRRVITLTTDFGLDDGYVGAVKGAILGINPEVQIVDISHSVDPQDLLQAAFIFGKSHRFFPSGTVHVVVVDPGVGSARRALALATPDGAFVAPDNGVLTWAIAERLGRERNLPRGKLRLRGTGLRAVSLTNPEYWLPKVGATFHARDIFGPVAAHLTLGVPLEQMGEPIADICLIELPRPQVRRDGAIVGHIVHIDRFGNLITDLTPADLASLGGEPVLEVVGKTIVGISRHYSERIGLLALVGSSGYIEIAANRSSAAHELMIRKDDVIVVRQSPRAEGER